MPSLITPSLAARRPVRVIDTGIRTGRENVAFDQALIEARNAGKCPETIRFLRFRPCALVGLHQMLSHEVRLDYCARQGIEVGRRITGGGGLYLDEGQIGWELVLERRRLGADLAAAAARICTAAAAGLRRLGVPAEFRPRNDIEAGGRKLCGTGGVVDGDTLFFQGTLLIDFDPARMIEALRIPVEKLARRDLEDARRRVVSLAELLGRVPPLEEIHAALLEGFREHLGLEPGWGEASEYEERLAGSSSRSSTAPTSSCTCWMRRRRPPRCPRRRWCAARGRCAPTSASKAGADDAHSRSAHHGRFLHQPGALGARPGSVPARPRRGRGRPGGRGLLRPARLRAPRPRAGRLPRSGGERARAAVVPRGRAAAARPLARRAAGAGARRSSSCTTRWAASGCGAISPTSW